MHTPDNIKKLIILMQTAKISPYKLDFKPTHCTL